MEWEGDLEEGSGCRGQLSRMRRSAQCASLFESRAGGSVTGKSEIRAVEMPSGSLLVQGKRVISHTEGPARW